MSGRSDARQMELGEPVNASGDGHVFARRHGVSRPVRWLGLAVSVALVVAVSACGGDDDASAEEEFCAASDSLRSSLEESGDITIELDGEGDWRDALDEQLSAFESDLDALRDSARDVAADELDAFESAIDQLGDDLDALGEDVSADAISDVGSSLSNVVSAARAVTETLESTCP